MTTRLTMTLVPEPTVARDAGVVGLGAAVRVVNQNFRQIHDLIERAILTGGLIGAGTIVSSMLATATRTLVGDVTGLIGAAADGGATSVVKMRGIALPAPVAGDDTKAIVYNHAGLAWAYADKLNDVLTTRGDLVRRGAAAEERVGVGGANSVLKSDGADPGWGTVTALLDTLFSSSQGAILYRGAASWAARAPGTSGYFLKTFGAGADPDWANPTAGASPLSTKGDIWGYSTLDARFPLSGAPDGYILTVDAASTFGFKWAAAGGGGNALLDGAVHTDTVAQTVSRGSLIYGNSTPKWDELVIGAAGKVVRSDGTDVSWQRPRALRTDRTTAIESFMGGGVNTDNGTIARTAGAATSNAAAADTDRHANKHTTSTSGNDPGNSWGTLLKPSMSPAMWADFKIVTFSKMFLQIGFGTGVGSLAAIGTTDRATLTWADGTDTNFRFHVGTNGGAPTNNDTGVAKDTNWHDVLIYTPDAGTTWKLEIDGVEVVSTTTTVPTTTTALTIQQKYFCSGAGSTGSDLRTSYCIVQCAKSVTT